MLFSRLFSTVFNTVFNPVFDAVFDWAAFTEEELVEQTRELQQPAAHRELHRWLERAVPTACGNGYMRPDDEGDCQGGSSGTFDLEPCEERTPAAALANWVD